MKERNSHDGGLKELRQQIVKAWTENFGAVERSGDAFVPSRIPRLAIDYAQALFDDLAERGFGSRDPECARAVESGGEAMSALISAYRNPRDRAEADGLDVISNPYHRAQSASELIELGSAGKPPALNSFEIERAASLYLEGPVRLDAIERLQIFSLVDNEIGHYLARASLNRILSRAAEKTLKRKNVFSFIFSSFFSGNEVSQNFGISKEQDMVMKMFDCWQISRSEAKYSLSKLRETLDSAEASGASWPTSIYALLADIEKRGHVWL